MRTINIFIFGDSLAYGAADTAALGWVGRVRQAFEQQKRAYYRFYNLAVLGEGLPSLLARMSYELAARQVKEVDNYIIIASGINDTQFFKQTPKYSLTEFQANYLNIIQAAKLFSKKIALVGLTRIDEARVSRSPWQKGHSFSNLRIAEFDQSIKQLAQANDIAYWSVAEILTTADLSDGLHPNSAGYQKLFTYLKPLVENLIQTKND